MNTETTRTIRLSDKDWIALVLATTQARTAYLADLRNAKDDEQRAYWQQEIDELHNAQLKLHQAVPGAP